jgi:Ser/Thr protein kinase RdoA (MazF antagonist)
MRKNIERFVRSGQIFDVVVDHRYGALEIVPQHGDLHGGNVLVLRARHPRPCVIDLAAYRHQHWALDVARLTVDIVMHCLDPSAESHFWDRWPLWRHVLIATSTFEAIADDSENPAAVNALRWVAGHRSELLPLMTDQGRWEWHVALAEQLLRSACRHRLPTPKRVLGLVGAHDQLRMAREAMPELSEDY